MSENNCYGIDLAEIECRQNSARFVLDVVKINGLAFTIDHKNFGPDLRYGLKERLFTEEDVLSRERIYQNSQNNI